MSEDRADARHAARLGAVQALYQMEMNGSGAEEVAQEFIEHRFGELPAVPDEGFFISVVQGVPPHQVEIAVGEMEAGAGGFHPARHPALRRLRTGGAA